MITDVILAVGSAIASWVLEWNTRLAFRYNRPTASDLRRLQRMSAFVRLSATRSAQFRWGGIGAMAAGLFLAAKIERNGDSSSLITITVLLIVGIVAVTLSRWWFIKLKFGKSGK
ncbi:MAG: hypothetical protein ACKOQM_02200 [Novosphingobium sp.]